MDTLTSAGAQALARLIEAYWQAKGYAGIVTRVDAIPRTRGTHETLYGVRSNIGPQGYSPVEPVIVLREHIAA